MTMMASSTDINKVDLDAIERAKLLAQSDAANALAQATPCGVPNCDFKMHEGHADPSEWYHRVHHVDVEGLEVEVTLHSDGHYFGWMAMDFIDDATADQMRTYAAECIEYAAALVAAADLTDKLNGEVKA